MICDTCVFKKECAFYKKIENISIMIDEILLDDECYANKISEAINVLECDEYKPFPTKDYNGETVCITTEEYQELLEYKAMYEVMK